MTSIIYRVLICVAFSAFVFSEAGYPLEVYVDFDGTGSGTLYRSGSVPTPALPSSKGDGGGVIGAYDDSEDIRRMEEWHRLRRRHQRIETIRRRRGRIKEWRKNLGIKVEIINKLLPEFNEAVKEERTRHLSQLERLALSINKIVVPPPPAPPSYKSVLFLGTGNSPEYAYTMKKAGAVNPFTRGEPYGTIVAFGETGFREDLIRSVFDHFLAERALLSKKTRERIGWLQGATIKQVVAHSNGATVAEVLIRTGVIRGVKEFRILGGDRSLMILDELQKLAEEKNIQIYVYANQGDVVSLLPTGWQIREKMERLSGPLSTFKNAKNLTYKMLGITRPDPPGSSHLIVQKFSVPPTWTSTEDRHIYENYYRQINARNLLGSLD